MPVQINNPNETEMIEVPLSEYEAVKALAAGVAEQNAAVQQQNAITQAAVKALGEQVLTAAKENKAVMETFTAAIRDALAGLQIVINVPEQPAPVINIPAPVVNIAPAEVTVKASPDKKKKVSMTMKRQSDGSYKVEGTEE